MSQLLEIGCEVEGAQEVEGGAVQKGDRCVSQLTTLLHRIEGEIVALQSLFATAEQHRYVSLVTNESVVQKLFASDQSKFSKMPKHSTHLRKNSYLISQVSENPNSQVKTDFWRDPAWQSIGVIVAVLLTILTIFVGWRQTQRKSFSYSVISRLNILDIEDDIKSKLQITFGSKNIQDLHLIIIKFGNSGNTPIIPSDFYRPININFGRNSEILSVELVGQSPTNLGATISHTSQLIEVSPLLLNKGDSFEVKILATEFQDVFIDGRIAGVKAIEEKDLSVPDTYVKYGLIITSAVITLLAGAIVNFTEYKNLPFNSESLRVILSIVIASATLALLSPSEIFSFLEKVKAKIKEP